MATTTLLRSLRQQRPISSAPLSAFKSLSGAKTKATATNLSYGFGVISRCFSWGLIGSEVIGIDFGTTNSRVVVRECEKIRSSSTPSVVAFNHKGEITVGAVAKHQAITDPQNTVFGVKRVIGRRFDDPQTRKEMRMVPYDIVKAPSGNAWIEANGQMYSPTQIASFVFAKLKETAENHLGKTVHEAVITVPSCFNDAQRRATKKAARIAGLNVRSFFNESKVTAISYALQKKRDGLIALVDLGGGTFDVSILKIAVSGDLYKFELRAENGDSSLGGKDFDEAIVDFVISEFKRTDGVNLTYDIVALQRLREAAEKAKIELSTATLTNIYLPYITTKAYGATKHLNITLTRSKFESQVNRLMKRIERLCKKCIKDSQIRTSELDQLILVGGMSHVPIVQEVVTEIFRKTPIKVVDPDERLELLGPYVMQGRT